MNQSKQTAFKFDRFFVKESHIVRNPGPAKSKGYELEIEPSGVIDCEKRVYSLTLEVDVKDKGGSFAARVVFVGIFEFREAEKLVLENYFYTNAPAILFPYVRAYISSLTALSGLPAINLPVMKFTKGRELKERTITVNNDK